MLHRASRRKPRLASVASERQQSPLAPHARVRRRGASTCQGKLGGQAQVPWGAGTWKDLTDNENAMAANLTGLCGKLARYLAPQVYNWIFTGRQTSPHSLPECHGRARHQLMHSSVNGSETLSLFPSGRGALL
jgi:hypothetical protein